jgi:hypothetical protein
LHLLSVWKLYQFDNEIKRQIGSNFIRFGEDIVFTYKNKGQSEFIESNLQRIASEVVGQNCVLHKPEVAYYYAGIPDFKSRLDSFYPVRSANDGKGILGHIEKTGLDFCGYHYKYSNNKVNVFIRYDTFTKMRIRINEFTDGGERRFKTLPKDSRITKGIIHKLNNYIGFYYSKEKSRWNAHNNLGIGSLDGKKAVIYSPPIFV